MFKQLQTSKILVYLFLFSFLFSHQAFGLTFSIKAVKINNVNITPSHNITIHPGDTVETEVFITDWASEGENFLLRDYELLFDPNVWKSGEQGLLLPLGWDAPYQGGVVCQNDEICVGSHCQPHNTIGGICAGFGCTNNSDCPDHFPVCTRFSSCAGLNHEPEIGTFIDKTRSDFIFKDVKVLNFSGLSIAALDFRFGGLILLFEGVIDPGLPAYVGTMTIRATDSTDQIGNACGEFTIDFKTTEDCVFSRITELGTLESVCNALLEPLTIHVDCSPPSEPRSIPAVSQWGLLILVLLLMISIRIKFDRVSTIDN